MRVLYCVDEWPVPPTSGAKVHDKIMMGCLTEEWRTDVAVWSEKDENSAKSAIPSAYVLPRRKLSWRTIVPSVVRLFMNKLPLHTSEFLSEAAKKKLKALVRSTGPDIIVLSCTRLAVIVPFLRSISSARLVVDTHDVHVQRCRSIYETLPIYRVGERLKQLLLMYSYEIVEKKIYREVDVAWALKAEDKALLDSFHSVPTVDIVPNVVDPATIRDVSSMIRANRVYPTSCVFIGDYSYQPNEQCAMMLMEWFSAEPISMLEISLYLIGVNATRAMQQRASCRKNVHITGHVAEISDYYHPVDTIFLAPLKAGGGVKRKVIEAMACGCPVITSIVGAEGLDLRHGEMAEVCSLAEFPAAICRLASDRDARFRYATRGLEHINSQFGYRKLQESVRKSLGALFGGTADERLDE